MKSMISIQTIIFFSLVLLAFSSRILAHKCIDHPNPFNPADNVYVDCKPVIRSNVIERDNLVDDADTENMFEVAGFQCNSNITGLCDNVKEAFITAGQIISKVFYLNSPVKINATLADFCHDLKICPDKRFISIGLARPARSVLLQDDDGVTRFYPQALAKQYQLPIHPEFLPLDITATFNSQIKWWFRKENRPIQEKEWDFLFIVLHELMHGLGFLSSWNDWINPLNASEALTPFPVFSNDPDGSDAIIFNGFKENGFDKYVSLLPSGQRISEINDQLNKFAGGPGTKFANETDFILQFLASPQYQVAKKVFKNAITANNLGFLPRGVSSLNDCVILETSIDPYVFGSSIDHVSLRRYENTSDFLMKFQFNGAETLEEMEERSKCLGAIGPGLKLIMQSLGFKTSTNLTPYKPTLPLPVHFPLTETRDS